MIAVKNIVGPYQPEVGAFGLRTQKGITWYTCREQFHLATNRRKDKSFFFAVNRNRFPGEALAGHPKVAEFLIELETRLGLETRCVLTDTDSPTLIHADPGGWWGGGMRFSLFSILLRAGLNYNGDVEAVLRTHPYCSRTQEAIKRFFAGYTCYTGSTGMWFNKFYNKSKEVVERLLVKEVVRASEKAEAEAARIMSLGRGDRNLLQHLIAEAIDRAAG